MNLDYDTSRHKSIKTTCVKARAA